MTVDELKERLNELAWDEQMDFEISERHSETSVDDMEETEGKIRKLAKKLTTTLLDQLEQDEGYVAWVLRLSPYVPGDKPAGRAERFRHHPDSSVRYWANKILQMHKS
jgi:hypothetical protein